MRRREFIVVVGGAAVWPLTARAQQGQSVRRGGVLMAHKEGDREFQDYLGAFRQGLLALGWIEGRNVQIDARWGALDDADQRQHSAKELLALHPDIVLTQNTPPTESMLQQTRTVPVIFVVVADPVGSGFVGSLARPGGNATGFTVMQPTTSAKWLELLKEIAPRVNRAAFLFNPATAPFAHYYLAPFNAAAASLGVQATVAPVHSKPELESVIAGQSPDTGLISMPDGFLNVHREELVSLAARYRLPAVYPLRFFLNWVGCCLTAAISAICSGLRRPTLIAQGRKAWRPSCAGTDQIRASDQSCDCQGTGPHRATVADRARRRIDRIAILFAAVHESAFGTKRTFQDAQSMSAFGGKADIDFLGPNVCF